jgi:hypothetical protein
MKHLKILLVCGILFPWGFIFGESAVEVRLEGDERQVKVEAFDAEASRWVAIASGYPTSGNSGWLKMPIQDKWVANELRVVASREASPFAGQVDSARPAEITVSDSPLAPGMGLFAADGVTANSRESSVEVEEADIWSWQGETLFIYNQYRGLQVLDMEDAEQPVWLDAYRYPARGEDLYAMADGRVAIIGTGAWWNSQDVEVELLQFDGATLSHTATVSLGTGSYMDSRRYGDYLYVMVRSWEAETDGRVSYQSPVMTLYSVDLNATSNDAVVDTRTYYGSGWLDAVMTAQPEGILVCVNQWSVETTWSSRWYSDVHVLLPSPDGTLSDLGTVALKGVIKDKFKLNFDGEVLTTISQQTDFNTGAFTRTTYVENFSIGGERPTPLGELELAPGETVFATRFYGDTIYVVTFLMVDPLFAIDNSDPSNPRVSGELKVPGWSNYIEWVDQWLFAIGYEDNRMTVSTFDVSDPENMSLTDRIFLSEDSWVGSEAQYDDQAISFYPNERLFMLPFQTYLWESSESIQAMQVISWDAAGKLQLRGAVQHLDVPRRGSLNGNTLVTVSGRELVSTDMSDLDVPMPAGKTTLAWDVTQVHVGEDYLLQLEQNINSGSYYYPYVANAYTAPLLVVTDLTNPNRAQLELRMAEGAVVGSYFADDRLTVIQDQSPDRTDYWTTPEAQSLLVTVYDFSDPLNPLTVSTSTSELPYIGESFGVQPYGDYLVWTNAPNQFGYGYFMVDAIFPGGVGARNPAYMVTGQVDASAETSILLHSVLPGGNQYYEPFSDWLWSAPLMFVSANIGGYVDNSEGGYYKRETILHSIDFSNPLEPVELELSRLPEDLQSIAKIGSGPEHYLYFGGFNEVSVWGWDGVNAFEIFTQAFPKALESEYWNPLAWDGSLLVRRGSLYSGVSENRLGFWWHAPGSESFVETGVLSLGSQYPQEAIIQDDLLLQSTSEGSILTFQIGPRGAVDLLSEQQTALRIGGLLQLAGSGLNGDDLFVPAGIYGVEHISLPLNFPLQESSRQQLEAGNDWYSLSEDRWSLVQRETPDNAGVVKELRWLYRPDTLRELDTAAVDAGDLWRDSKWLGWYAYDANDPQWIQHLEHGYLYTVTTDSPERDGLYLFDNQLGYLWTHQSSYPWLYAYNTSEWLYYLRGSGMGEKRWFSGTSSGWIAVDR